MLESEVLYMSRSIERVISFLEQKGMGDRVITFEASTATVELAAQALGVEPGHMAKTMSFLVDGAPLLVVLAGDVRVDNHRFKEAFHKKGRMIPFDQVASARSRSKRGCRFIWMNRCTALRRSIPLREMITVPCA